MCDIPESSVGWYIIETKYSFLKIEMGGADGEDIVTTDLEKLAATWRIEISIGSN